MPHFVIGLALHQNGSHETPVKPVELGEESLTEDCFVFGCWGQI